MLTKGVSQTSLVMSTAKVAIERAIPDSLTRGHCSAGTRTRFPGTKDAVQVADAHGDGMGPVRKRELIARHCVLLHSFRRGEGHRPYAVFIPIREATQEGRSARGDGGRERNHRGDDRPLPASQGLPGDPRGPLGARPRPGGRVHPRAFARSIASKGAGRYNRRGRFRGGRPAGSHRRRIRHEHSCHHVAPRAARLDHPRSFAPTPRPSPSSPPSTGAGISAGSPSTRPAASSP